MFRLKFLVLLSSFLVVGCPATTMLREPTETLLPPPKREQFANRAAFAEAIEKYQLYLESYRGTLVNEVAKEQINPECLRVIIAKPLVLPRAQPIASDNVRDQLNEVLNYVDQIRLAVDTHNKILLSQIELYKQLCPSVDEYILP